MKKILLFLCAAAATLSGWSATFNRLTVELKDNSTVEIVMTDDLRMKFENDNLVAKGTAADVTIPESDIVNIVHSSSNSVQDALATEGFEFNNGLLFHNLPAGSHIYIYDVNGKMEASEDAEGEFTLPIDGLSRGTHIVSVNGKSYKILIK